MRKKKTISPKQEEFDYSKFEKEAISKLMEGKDLIGPDGVLKEIIQRIVHSVLEGELDHRLKTERQAKQASGEEKNNRRNDSTSKQLKTSIGEVSITPPRDRAGTFDPILVGKWDRI